MAYLAACRDAVRPPPTCAQCTDELCLQRVAPAPPANGCCLTTTRAAATRAVTWDNGNVTASREQSFYDAIGRHATFVRIVHRFYAGVADDPVLRAVYPEEDLGPAEERLRMFLEQYWGGPTTYPSVGVTPGSACGTPCSR